MGLSMGIRNNGGMGSGGIREVVGMGYGEVDKRWGCRAPRVCLPI